MKKFLTLIFGLLIAGAAAYAIPKDLKKMELKDVFKIEISQDVAVHVVDADIQIDVDDGVVVATNFDIKSAAEKLEFKYIVMDEGVPQAGYRRWFSPGNYIDNNPEKGLFDKSRAMKVKSEYTGFIRSRLDFSRKYNLIE